MSERLEMDFGHDLIDNGTSDDYYTPPFIFEALKIEFDMDVAAPPNGVPWIPAKRSLTIIDNGLTTPWVGSVWCNPPYSNPRPWVEKLIKHNNGIALLPMSKSGWLNLVWGKSSGILALPWNTKFVRANGASAGIMFSSFLYSFGDDMREVLCNSNLGVVR